MHSLTTGQIVHVRSRRWLVDEVVPPVSPSDDTVARLSCLDDDAQGDVVDVLWEREVDAHIVGESSWANVAKRGFDDPRKFSAYLHTLRWSTVTATNPRLFQAPYRAGIDVLAYQLEPLRKALLLPRVNLFIADDVGLGKTIEAALIARELLLRQKVRRIVVACPPSVVLQWQAELETRFGLRFVVFDREYVIERRRERGYGTNPWATHTRFIISHALLRDETYAAPLRDWLAGDDDPAQGEPRGTLLILDEAHNAAPASGSRYAIDSRFTRVVREIAALFEHRLFLSATPHNGHSNSFSALLEILDPHRFCRGVPVTPKHLDAIMVRRLKSDLAEAAISFPKRNVVQVDLAGLPTDAPELSLSRLLDEYRKVRESAIPAGSKTARAAVGIVLTALQKRLLSSIEAFASTLRVHRRALERSRVTDAKRRSAPNLDPQQLSLLDAPGPDDERAEQSEDDVRSADEQEIEIVTESMASSTPESTLDAQERDLLDRMTTIAEQARHKPDARVKWLIDFVRKHCLVESRWRVPSDDDKSTVRRLLIFTEYADTKRWLDEQLRAALERTDRGADRIATFHGGMDEESREEIKRAFNANLSHPLRILIATDAAREGVNLQGRCADLFHFDVPWNPSRMEQRNGRIDRKGQLSPDVRCHYFVFTQRPEDRVLSTLVRKTANIQKELGSLSPVLEGRMSRLLEMGIRHLDAERLAGDIAQTEMPADFTAAVDEELEQSARLRHSALIQQVNVLKKLMAAAQDHLGFDEKHFRDAVSVSLEMLGTKGLTETEVIDPAGDGKTTLRAFRLPTDDPRLVKDPSWADTLDSLRVPRARHQELREWRNEAPLRSVIFRDTGTLDEHLVHLHLEHRLVQRLLGRFLAQGFVHDDLSRATVVRSGDSVDRVVLLGRLSLYGERAARLHDEIVVVAAPWVDPRVRVVLEPYGDDGTEKSQRLLDEALEEDALRERRPVADIAKAKLLESVEQDIAELSGRLRAQCEIRARKATDQLAARGAKEAADLAEVLDVQKKRIQKMVADTDTSQLALGFAEAERKQLEANVRHWKKRLVEIEAEAQHEPKRIETGYAVRASRVDIVGVAYLWGKAS